MAVYYVNSGGTNASDSNDGGSPGSAFLTLSQATGVTNPGDTVYIMNGVGYGGGIAGGNVLFISRSGSATGGYITYTNYPGHRPVINSARFRDAIGIFANYIVINGLDIAGFNGAITLAAAQTNAADPSWATSTVYNACGILSDDNGGNNTITTNATTTSGAVLHFVSGGTAAVAGMVAYDTTHTTIIPVGTTVLSSTATTVTLSANVTGGGVSNGDVIKFFAAHHHIKITNNWVHDFSQSGISVDYIDYLTVSGNIVWNCCQYSPFGGSGISIGFAKDVDTFTGQKIFVQGNIVYGCSNLVGDNNSTNTNITTNGTTAIGNSTLHFASTTGVTQGDLVWDLTTNGAITSRTTVVSTTSSTVVISNPVISPGVGATDAFHFSAVTDGEGIIIDTANLAPAYVGRTLISNNIVFGNGSNGIEAYNSNHVDIWNNTSYLNLNDGAVQATGEIYVGTATDCTVANNIIQGSVTSVLTAQNSSTSITWINNLGFGGNGTALLGTGNISGVDPQFVVPSTDPTLYNFLIKPGSPAIGNANATYAVSTDVRGMARPAGTNNDIGAYENQTGGTYGITYRTIAYIMSNDVQDGQGNLGVTLAKIREAILSAYLNNPASW